MRLLMPDDFSELNVVGWRVEQAVPAPENPLLEPAMPWDGGGIMAHGTVAKDPLDGKWKAWQISTPPEEELPLTGTNQVQLRQLTYLESDDGIHWVRPMLPLVEWSGHTHTNLLFSSADGGSSQYASVLIDPDNTQWPYEMFIFRKPGPIPSKNPAAKYPLFRYRSKDGKAWELFAGPLEMGAATDVCYIYREPDGSYVAYSKANMPANPGDRLLVYDNAIITQNLIRKVVRQVSPDGNTWSERAVVLERDWRDPDTSQFLEIGYLPVPGGYVGTVNHYNPSIKTMELQLAASRDGVHWWRPDRRPALANGPLGDYGGGMIWQMRQPIPDNGHLYVYYCGTEGIHGELYDTRFTPRIEVGNETVIGAKMPTLPFNGALCRAAWRLDRLWALAPAAGGVTLGMAVTTPQPCGGRELWVNALAKPRGSLKAELLGADGEVLNGFSRDDCTPLQGDHGAARFIWAGGDKAPTTANRVRFVLQRAFLYGFEWRD